MTSNIKCKSLKNYISLEKILLEKHTKHDQICFITSGNKNATEGKYWMWKNSKGKQRYVLISFSNKSQYLHIYTVLNPNIIDYKIWCIRNGKGFFFLLYKCIPVWMWFDTESFNFILECTNIVLCFLVIKNYACQFCKILYKY